MPEPKVAVRLSKHWIVNMVDKATKTKFTHHVWADSFDDMLLGLRIAKVTTKEIVQVVLEENSGGFCIVVE